MAVNYRAFIVDPDPGTRLLLRQAMAVVPFFSEVSQFGDPQGALERLGAGEECDILFLSHHIHSARIAEVIASAKKTVPGVVAAYVLVINRAQQSYTNVATELLHGADAFLFEPYSVDALTEITELATKVKVERCLERNRFAIALLVTDLVQQVDIVASLVKAGYEPGVAVRELRETCKTVQRLDEEGRQFYFETAVNLFGEAPVSSDVVSAGRYCGASQRVRKRVGAKVAEESES